MKPFELKKLRDSYTKNLNNRQKALLNNLVDGHSDLKGLDDKFIDKPFIEALIASQYSLISVAEKVPTRFDFYDIMQEMINNQIVDCEYFENEAIALIDNDYLTSVQATVLRAMFK